MTTKTIYEISESYFDATALTRCNFIRKPKTSWRLVDWVMAHSSLEGNSKLVAGAISTFYNKKLGYAYPTALHIGAMTGLSRSSIDRAVRDMKLSGEWVIVNIKDINTINQTVNRYIPMSPAISDPKKDFTGYAQKFNPNLKLNYGQHLVDIWQPTILYAYLKTSPLISSAFSTQVKLELDKASVESLLNYDERLEGSIFFRNYKNTSEKKKAYDLWLREGWKRFGFGDDKLQ